MGKVNYLGMENSTPKSGDFGSQFWYAKLRRSQDMLLVGPQADQLLNRTAEEITEKQLFRTGTASAENKMKLYIKIDNQIEDRMVSEW